MKQLKHSGINGCHTKIRYGIHNVRRLILQTIFNETLFIIL